MEGFSARRSSREIHDWHNPERSASPIWVSRWLLRRRRTFAAMWMRSLSVLIGLLLLPGCARGDAWVATIDATAGNGGLSRELVSGAAGSRF
jgi:hypothetical protein